MIRLRDITDIDAHKARHPRHETVYWLKGELVEEGSIVHFEEYFNGVPRGLTFRFVEVICRTNRRTRVADLVGIKRRC